MENIENIENQVTNDPMIEQNAIIPSVSDFAVRSPAVIAAEINMIKSQTASIIHTLGGHIRSGVYEIGRLLCEAKASIPHGEWGTWLETNVAYSDSTAQNLMRIYRELSDGQVDIVTGKTQGELFAGLDYSQVIEVLKLPREQRVALVEENDLEGMSSREIKALIKEKKELEKRVTERDEEIIDLTQAKNNAEMNLIEAEVAYERLEKEKATVQNTLDKANAERDKAVKESEKAYKSELRKLNKEIEVLRAIQPVAEVSAEEIEKIKSEAIAEVEAKHKVSLEQITLEANSKVEAARAEAEAEAQKRIEELKARYAAASDDTVKVVSVLIEQVSELLSKISARVEGADGEIKDKLRSAVSKLLISASESFKDC